VRMAVHLRSCMYGSACGSVRLCGIVRQCATVCGSACGSMRQCVVVRTVMCEHHCVHYAQQCAAERLVVCGSEAVRVQ